MYTVDVALSDVDRGVYESLSIKAACHPSETEEYFATRILAYCLEYKEGISFSKGLREADVPAISVRDLTGALTAWIEIGSPDAARLHKASKASPRVAVYTHKEPRIFLRAYEGERIHKAESLELYAVDRELLAAFRNDAMQIRVCVLTALARYACSQINENTCVSVSRATAIYADMVSRTAELLRMNGGALAPNFAGTM